MSSAFDPVDLWFEKGFRIRAQKAATTRRDAVRAKSGGFPSGGGVKFSDGAKAKNIKAVIKKAPEVMVKITGNSSGLATVKHHLDYISRNGEVPMFDETGNTLTGKDDTKALMAALKASQVPQESGKREFLHVLFSMPPGTPEKSMKEAVKAFCQEEFGNRQYVAALHEDTKHTHVHVCVSTRDMDRADEPRLSPRKADLFRWRQGFADKLRENGIDAAASERRHRMNYRKAEHPVIRQIRADNPESAVYNKARAEEKALAKRMKNPSAPKGTSKSQEQKEGFPRVPTVIDAQKTALHAALKTGIRPENPFASEIEKSRSETLRGWTEVQKNLVASGQSDLAKDVEKIIAAGQKPVRSQAQELFDTAQSRARDRAKDSEQSL